MFLLPFLSNLLTLTWTTHVHKLKMSPHAKPGKCAYTPKQFSKHRIVLKTSLTGAATLMWCREKQVLAAEYTLFVWGFFFPWPGGMADCLSDSLHLSQQLSSYSPCGSCLFPFLWGSLTRYCTSGRCDRTRGPGFPHHCCETPLRWWNCHADVSLGHGGTLVSLWLSARLRGTSLMKYSCDWASLAHTIFTKEEILLRNLCVSVPVSRV